MRATTEQHDTLAAPGVIAFCDTSSPCVGTQHPSFPALFYLDIRADEPSGHTSFFSGYVTKEVAALVKAAPDLLEALKALVACAQEERQIFRECAQLNDGSGAIPDESDREALATFDARINPALAAIAKANGARS